MARNKSLLTLPTWQVLAVLHELDDVAESAKVLYDDPELTHVLAAAAFTLRTLVRDEVRLGNISEEEYDKQTELAETYAQIVRDDVDFEARGVFGEV